MIEQEINTNHRCLSPAYFWGQRIVSVRSDWSDMFDEIICLDNVHAGHTKKSPRDDGFSQGIMLSQSANVAIIGYLVQMSLNICTYICCGVSAFAKRHLIGHFWLLSFTSRHVPQGG